MDVLRLWFILVFSSRTTVPFDVKKSFFSVAHEHRVVSGILATFTVSSAIDCTGECLASAGCMACNWQEASRTCELLGAHAEPLAAPGYTACTRFCKVTEKGSEFKGSLSVTTSGRVCQHWYNNCDPHCDLEYLEGLMIVESMEGPGELDMEVSPGNFCRNPNFTPEGPWCYTKDPNVRTEACDVPYC